MPYVLCDFITFIPFCVCVCVCISCVCVFSVTIHTWVPPPGDTCQIYWWTHQRRCNSWLWVPYVLCDFLLLYLYFVCLCLYVCMIITSPYLLRHWLVCVCVCFGHHRPVTPLESAHVTAHGTLQYLDVFSFLMCDSFLYLNTFILFYYSVLLFIMYFVVLLLTKW